MRLRFSVISFALSILLLPSLVLPSLAAAQAPSAAPTAAPAAAASPPAAAPAAPPSAHPATASAPAAPAATAAPRVYTDAGNIFIERNGVKTQLTKSEQDVRPALSPDGSYVVYTRQGRGRSVPGYDLGQFCVDTPRSDELRRVNVDGSGDKLLLKGRKGAGDAQLCDFRSKQFSSDGTRLYFLTPGWTTSGALHVYDLRTHEQHFLVPATDLLVLNFCANRYKDDLVVQSHRYLVFGGSYDWYWLYDSSGRKELGPVGYFHSPDAMRKAAHQQWCAE
jgi:WD40-like Beta Propeller Repeat